MIVGQDKYRYERVEGWVKLPEYFNFDTSGGLPGGVAGVATDSRDRIYVFNRGNHPIMIFDRDGNFISCWGEGHFRGAHGIFIDKDDSVYLADFQTHVVEKFTPSGELLWSLGTRDWGMPPLYKQPFCMPTRLVVGPLGDLFVSDGYAGFFVHKFSPKGELIKTWGGPGHEPGQLQWPHCIDVDKHGIVYVCDRENDRIQLFTSDGELINVWTDFANPQNIRIDRENDIIYITEGNILALSRPIDRPKVSIRNLKGEILSMWEGRESEGKGVLEVPHDICVDSKGDIYIGEVGDVPRIQKFAKL
jgi:DNA-binding beta-propeller fold protein YncE